MIQNVGGYRGLTQMQELNKYSHKQNNQLKAQQFPVSKEIFRINDLINEYEHFNASGRKNLLEIMAIAPMKITNKITSTYTKDGKSYTDVIYDPEQDTQEYPTKEEIIIRTKSKYGKELGYFEKEFDFLKKNLNSMTLAKALKNIGNAFEEYDKRGQNYRADVAKKKANNSILDARNYWNQLINYG